MKIDDEKLMEISSILEEIHQLDKMISLHKSHSDDDFMVSQYEYKRLKLYKEFSILLLRLDINSNRILQIIQKLLRKIYISDGLRILPKKLEKNLKEIDSILT